MLYKFKILNENAAQGLQKIVISVLLPFLAFYSFLRNAESSDLKQIGIVFGLSAGYYILLTSIALIWVRYLPKMLPKYVIKRAEKEHNEWLAQTELDNKEMFNAQAFLESLKKKHLVTWLMCIYGSNIVFATPIILGVYSNGIELASLNVWNILYYIGGFGFAFSLISGVKFTKKEFKFSLLKTIKNGSFIAAISAIILWATQYIPGAGAKTIVLGDVKNGLIILADKTTQNIGITHMATFGPNFQTLYGYSDHGTMIWFIKTGVDANSNLLLQRYAGSPTGWFDWSITMPYLYKFISMLAALVSPLIWMVIGTSLAKSNLKEMFRSKDNWIFMVLKMIVMPIVMLAIVIPFVYAGILKPNVGAILVMVGSVPPGTTIVIYSQNFKVHDKYTSQVSSLATVFSFIFIPVWLLIGSAVMNAIAAH
ncbi:malate permease [Metamycoplasma cloacale]|uniref:Malate permease n=2 Tax=Metamycoplasma cloacale TaxID=92401 RepID=A0A2Z4LMM9_9BACT|nr:malate permease [Metamycoplasma cloacale]